MRRAEQVASRPKPGTLKATAYHEAGHAMAAWYLEVPFVKGKHVLSIVPDGSTQGHCQYKNILSGRNIDASSTGGDRLKMERMSTVTLAGLAAQRRHRPSSVRSWQGSADFHSAVDLVRCFTESDRETEAYLKLLQIRAEQILDKPCVWECVEALAAALLDRKTLSFTEVAEIIKATHARILENHVKSRGVPLASKKPTRVGPAQSRGERVSC